MAERQLKGLYYNCDDKYFPGHKCKEQNLFMAIFEDIQEEDVDTPPVPESPEISDIHPPSDPPEVEPIIFLNALTDFSTPQTLNLIGYLKHRKVIILVDSGRTHNFIHRRIPKKPIATSMLSTISKSWLPMVVLWNVVGTVKMFISKSVTTN